MVATVWHLLSLRKCDFISLVSMEQR